MPKINGREVGPIGFGLMGLTWRSDPPPQEQAFAAMRAALDAGCTFWNGGEFYGPPTYNSPILIQRFLAADATTTTHHRQEDDAARIVLSIKGGTDLKTYGYDGGPDGVRRSLDNTLHLLNGCLGSGGGRGGPQPGRVDLDLFECARRDPAVPLADSLGTMQREYVDRGKLGGIALSEVSAATIHEAVATGIPIAAVEAELSLWSTDVLTNGVAAACAQHDLPLIAYSPLGRGVLTGAIRSPDDFPANDVRRRFPRFHPDNFAVNLQLVDAVNALAAAKACTPAQLAINWVRCLAGRPGVPKIIIPIPGATTPERVRENGTVVEISEAEMEQLDAIIAKFEIKGNRYPDGFPHNT